MFDGGLVCGSLLVEAGTGDVVDGAAVLMNPTGRRIAGWCGVVGPNPRCGLAATNPRMKRCLRDSGRAARLELVAQHRQNLGTEHVQLLEDGGEGQAGVVDEEGAGIVQFGHFAQAVGI